MFNKKGQEGVTLTTLILIVIGAIVAVVIILGATGALDFVFGKVNVAPGQDLETLVQSCKISAQNNLKADYCKTFKEIELSSGLNTWANCQYSEVKGLLSSTEMISDTECGTEEMNAREFCQQLKTQKGQSFDADKTIVNGKSCGSAGWNLVGPTQ